MEHPATAGTRSNGSRLGRAAVALALAVASAGAITAGVEYRQASAPSPTATIAPVQADAEVQAMKAEAMRYFNLDAQPAEGATFQVNAFSEVQVEFAKADQVKRVMIDNCCGSVVVIHHHGPDVLVLAGKVVQGPDYNRAREYAKKLNYNLKKSDDRIRVTLTQPATKPDDIFGSDVRCIVIAPENVTVLNRSGQREQQ